jgi:thioredoxin reductase (NADPH)
MPCLYGLIPLMNETDTAIIGAGPIGLELAVALKKARIDYLHFDGGQIGHTISWFAPQTRFFSSNDRIAIAGVPLQTPDQGKATREEYLAYLRGVVQQFELDVHTYEPVRAIERSGGHIDLTTEKAGQRRRYRARRLVLVTGGTSRPRRLNIPGEDLPHVSHYFKDPHDYFRTRLMIVGGRNSAVEAALRCHHAGARVILSYRRGELDAKSIKYWLMPEIGGLMESGRIEAHFNTQPVEICGGHVKLRRADGETIDVPVDFVLLLIGYEADMSLCRMAGVELHGPSQVPVFNEQTMETSAPGVYVAGTAVGGTQERYRLFIENCHVHVDRIVAALTGTAPPPPPRPIARPES